MSEPPGGLSIGELARKTGVPVATLRSWEDRYGFPRPRRLAGGHRRYEKADAALIAEVTRLRASGVSLPAAIGAVTARPAGEEASPAAGLSLFASLRDRHPGLVPQELSKAGLLAITRAMEDECYARAEHSALFAGFQQERFYRQSGERWAELARTARFVVVFADFGEPAEPGALSSGAQSSGAQSSGAQSSGAQSSGALSSGALSPPGVPLTVRIPAGAPLRREWFVVCAARDYPAFVSAWEFPGGAGVPDPRRRFEAVWSVDPPVVRDAALSCARMARALSPGLEPVLAGLPDEVAAPASPDLQRAMGLLTRMTSYLDKRG